MRKGGKNVSVEFRVFGKKMKEKFREKKSKCFGWKFKVKVVNVEKNFKDQGFFFFYLVCARSLGDMLIEKFNHMG